MRPPLGVKSGVGVDSKTVFRRIACHVGRAIAVLLRVPADEDIAVPGHLARVAQHGHDAAFGIGAVAVGWRIAAFVGIVGYSTGLAKKKLTLRVFANLAV